jgi:MFS transporter, FHS family, glucose/mannose:H+ symporter
MHASVQDTSARRALTFSAYASFVPIGIATILLGPMLPILKDRWALNDAQAGALFTVQYAASTCAVALSGVLASRRGFRFAIKTGLILVAAGLACLLAGPRWLAMLSIAAYGFGNGLAVPAANFLVAEANPDRRSSTLNLLNFFWSTGAVACPFLVAAAAKRGQIPLFLGIVSLVSLAIVLGIAAMPRRITEPAPAHDSTAPMLPLIRNHFSSFLILAGLFFLYVGVENGFGQWIASFSKTLGTLPLATAVMTPSFFYASLTLGRWIATFILHAISDIALARLGLLLACAGMAGLIFSHALPGVIASACAAGLGLASVYPITIALLSREFPSPRIGSFMFTLSNIGGGLFPWLVGVSSTHFNSLKAGLIIPPTLCSGMFVLYLRQWSNSHPTQAAEVDIDLSS